MVRQDAIVPPGMTYLESRSVRTPTILDYTKRFQEFQGWMNMHQINIASPLDLDSAAVEFLEDLFEANRGVNDGVRVIAAIKFFWPHLAKEIPRTSRALKGWNFWQLRLNSGCQCQSRCCRPSWAFFCSGGAGSQL